MISHRGWWDSSRLSPMPPRILRRAEETRSDSRSTTKWPMDLAQCAWQDAAIPPDRADNGRLSFWPDKRVCPDVSYALPAHEA